MKYANRFAIVAALAMSAAAARAASFDFTGDHYPPEVAGQSTLTRAQVNAQVQDAMAKGQLQARWRCLSAPVPATAIQQPQP